MRKDVAAKSSAATGAKPSAAAPDAAQAEAVRAAAGDDDETAEASAADGTEEDSADAPAPVPRRSRRPRPPRSRGHGTCDRRRLGDRAASADPGAAIEAATPADPRIAALLSEAAKVDGKDRPQQGGPLPAPDGLAAPDPSAPASQAKGADAAAPAAAETRPAVSVQAPLSAVPITIGMRALAGSNRFEIRLDPYELGRIDVSLDIAREHGTVKAHLTVERPETLALLQRDAAACSRRSRKPGSIPARRASPSPCATAAARTRSATRPAGRKAPTARPPRRRRRRPRRRCATSASASASTSESSGDARSDRRPMTTTLARSR